eukprot:2504425-Pleurochrysis_carterae.AAC.1
MTLEAASAVCSSSIWGESGRQARTNVSVNDEKPRSCRRQLRCAVREMPEDVSLSMLQVSKECNKGPTSSFTPSDPL